MTANEIYELARKHQPAPEDMTLPEQLLYTTARNIYKSYSDGIISLEQAKREKIQSIRNFEGLVNKYEIMKQHYAIIVALNPYFTKAEKGDCENCKKIARIFDGRDRVE